MRASKAYLYFLAVCMLLLSGCEKLQKPRTDWSITLAKTGKRPYDTYIAFHFLYFYFPEAKLHPLPHNYDFTKLGYSDYDTEEGKSLLVVVGRTVNFSQGEWEVLRSFLEKGNEVLCCVADIDEKIQKEFYFRQHGNKEIIPLSENNSGAENWRALSLSALPDKRFGFWGRDLKGFFTLGDADTIVFNPETSVYSGPPEILGRTDVKGQAQREPNFIRYTVGDGHLTLVATPLVLSNYFLLQDGNRAYADGLWQSLPANIRKIYWAGFTNRVGNESTFSILWRNPALRWAIIAVLILCMAYLVFQSKRMQRVVPVIPDPVNSSMAFIETVGMLYYNKGDNRNLALKMEQHFLEWVRTKFHLNTNQLNDIFAEQLQLKSGIDPATVQHTLGLIHQLRLSEGPVSDELLMDLYQYVQVFYKKH